MLAFIAKLFRRKPTSPAWSYIDHEYRGVDAGAHVYLVSFQRVRRGEVEREAGVYRFHAATTKPKDDVKMTAHFRREAEKRSR